MWEGTGGEPGSSCECGAFSQELCALSQARSFIGSMDMQSHRIIIRTQKIHVTLYCLLQNSSLQMQGNSSITEIKRRWIASFLFPEHRPRLS